MTNTDYAADDLPTVAPYLLRYLHAQVTIYYHPAGGGVTDTGRVTYIDNYWVELTKDNKDILLIPVVAIRLVKVADATKLRGDAGILLRAIDAPPEEQRKQIGK